MSIKNTFFRVVTYHRIASIQDSLPLDPAMISATPEEYVRQMQYLANHYNVISISNILEALSYGKGLPPRAVLITFDDGYYDLLDKAWPVLKKLKLPSVIFVATDYASNPKKVFWWDRIANAILNTRRDKLDIPPLNIYLPESHNERRNSVKKVQSLLKNIKDSKRTELVDEICQFLGEKKHPVNVSLNWDQLRKLHHEGVIIGAHSQSHPLLTQISLNDAQAEILGSQNALKHELNETCPIFCYPNGNYNEAIITILKNNQFRLAFTTRDGHNDLRSCNPYTLCRTNISVRTSVSILKFRLTRLGAMVDNWRHR